MILAALATEFYFRKERKIKDERDAEYAATGVKVGYYTLITLIVGLSFYLAITPPIFREALSHFVLGNTLIALILTSYTAQLITRLYAYSHDRFNYELESEYS